MRRRITVAIVATAAAAIVVFGAPLAFALQRLYLAEARTALERQAILLARDLPDDRPPADGLERVRARALGLHVAVYATDGTLLGGDGPPVGDAAVREAAATTVASHEIGDRLVAAIPITTDADTVAVLRVEGTTNAAEHRTRLALGLMSVLGILTVAGATVLASFVAKRLARPVRDVRDAAVRLGQGDFRLSLPATGVAELDALSDALVRTGTELGDAIDRERSLTAHISHQLRTPITGLRVAIEAELAAPRSDPATALTEHLAIADRLDRTVTDLIRLARQPSTDDTVDVSALTTHLRGHWVTRFDRLGRHLSIEPAPSATTAVSGSTAAIVHALDVLVDNALRHGRGDVTVAFQPIAGGLAIDVNDEGTGPNPNGDNPPADGHGLGLGIAASLVSAQGGRLRLPTPSAPSTYRIVLTAAPLT